MISTTPIFDIIHYSKWKNVKGHLELYTSQDYKNEVELKWAGILMSFPVWIDYVSCIMNIHIEISITSIIHEWSGGVIKTCFKVLWLLCSPHSFHSSDGVTVYVLSIGWFVCVCSSHRNTQPLMASYASNGELQCGKKWHVTVDQASLGSGQSWAGSRYQNRPFKALP